MSRPKFKKHHPNYKERLYIVCDGLADELFLKELFKFVSLKFEVKIEPAGSINKVFKTYRKIKSIYGEIEVLILIDLDGIGNKNIEEINLDFENNGYKKPSQVYYINPVIEYMFIAVKENKNSKFTKKEDYKSDIKRIYGIESYEGTKKECEHILKQITDEEFLQLLDKLSKCDRDPNSLPSTNLIELIEYLKE